MGTPKEISIRSSNANANTAGPRVETVEEQEDNSSSWASNDDLRRAAIIRQKLQQQQQQQQQQQRKRGRIRINGCNEEETTTNTTIGKRSAPARLEGGAVLLRRAKTPTTNNLSTLGGFFSEYDDSIDEEDLTTLLPPTIIMEGQEGEGTPSSSKHQQRHNNNKKEKQQTKQQPSSYRKWLTEGMLEALNVVAGITLSTTGTLLSPPIAITRNIILPGILALVVDTIDAVTPLRVQDWFRILSSSVYHLFVVLIAGSTERGLKFRSQVALVAQSFLEAWSAPESRQVIVDGMATGVKLADALQ